VRRRGPGPRYRCRLRRWYIPRQPAAEDAAIEGAHRNIQRQYDLFAAFLDPSMTYRRAAGTRHEDAPPRGELT
jgi:hypothetical protein